MAPLPDPRTNPENYVEVEYRGPTGHNHMITGVSGVEYMYGRGGQVLNVLKTDQQSQPMLFVPVVNGQVSGKEQSVDEIEAQIAALKQQAADIAAAQSGEQQLDGEQNINKVEPPANLPAAQTAPEQIAADDFTAIDGIGQAGDAKLKAAGIITYSTLASSSAEQVVAILGSPVNADKAQAMIASAGNLAQGN